MFSHSCCHCVCAILCCSLCLIVINIPFPCYIAFIIIIFIDDGTVKLIGHNNSFFWKSNCSHFTVELYIWMIVKEIYYKRKGNQRLKPPMAGGKRGERVFDCLRAMKSYNLISQQTSTSNALFNISIFQFKRIKKKLHVTGTWRFIIPLSAFVYV